MCEIDINQFNWLRDLDVVFHHFVFTVFVHFIIIMWFFLCIVLDEWAWLEPVKKCSILLIYRNVANMFCFIPTFYCIYLSCINNIVKQELFF